MTERKLEQHEIDALVRGVMSGEIPTGADSLVNVTQAQPLDFKDGWNKGRVIQRAPVLDLVFDRLGPLLQVTLTKSLRFPVRCSLQGITITTFRDLLARADFNPCLYAVLRMQPLRGYAFVEFEPTLIYGLVDALMGGSGEGNVPGDREVSDIEVNLVRKTLLDIARDFENAWRPWFPLNVDYARSELPRTAAAAIQGDDVCYVGTLEMVGESLEPTPARFILAHKMIEPINEATSLRLGDELDPNWRDHLDESLRAAEACVSVQVGETEISTQRCRELAEGDVIELTRKLHEPVDILVEDVRRFSGFIGQRGGQYAVTIDSRLASNLQTVDHTVGQRLVRKGLISHEQLAVALVDEVLNRKNLIDSISSRGWADRNTLQAALGS